MTQQKEIKELANMFAIRPCSCEDCSPCDRLGTRCKEYQVAEKIYSSGYRKQNEWISVNDKLPDFPDRVLVCVEGNKFSSTSVDTDRIVDGKWVRWEGSVTHWMLIPNLPSNL